MIAHLRGILLERLGGAVVIECAGVGYEVSVSAHTNNALPALGEEVSVRVFTHAHESKIALFGFASAEERALFDLLVTVKKVGPSSAIKILSAGADPQAIAQMIASEQTRALQSIKGVGKKTAEMLVVELREKCEMLLATWGAGGGIHPRAPVARGSGVLTDPVLVEVTGALVQLGWRPAEAERAVATLEPDPQASLEMRIRDALRAAMTR